MNSPVLTFAFKGIVNLADIMRPSPAKNDLGMRVCLPFFDL